MNSHKNGIRKAAILVASLDRPTADRMLEQMDPRQAQRVRQMMVELDQIDPEEQERIIDEFFRIGPMLPQKHPPGIELDGRLARELSSGSNDVARDVAPPTGPPDAPPFRFLREAEGDKLARILATERPQTIALVLSHLSPEQAGTVLVRLNAALQVDVIRRLVDLEETEPEILREVERALQSRLSQQILMQRRRVAGLSAVAEILKASEQQVGMQILDNLACHDQLLAERLSPARPQFDDLAALDDDTLNTLLEAADPELVILALVGAPPELMERLLRKVPESELQLVRHRLDHLGPTRLSDVEEARRQVVELAQHLIMLRRPQTMKSAA